MIYVYKFEFLCSGAYLSWPPWYSHRNHNDNVLPMDLLSCCMFGNTKETTELPAHTHTHTHTHKGMSRVVSGTIFHQALRACMVSVLQ